MRRLFVLALLLVACARGAALAPAPAALPGRLLLSFSSPPPPPPRLEAHFLDVGQGDAIYLQGPDGRNLLVDAGGDDTAAVLEFLRARGVRRLDTVLVTHAHDDHFGGLFSVVGRVPIGRFLYGTRVEAPRWKRLEAQLERAGVDRTHVKTGDVVELGGGARASVLHAGPPEAPWITDTTPDTGVNGFSVVLRVEFGRTAYLLTGDAPGAVEDELARSGRDSALLKVAHHGSRGSSTARFLAGVRPTWAVIQAGRANDHGHPHREALQRLEAAGATLLRTDLRGTISTSSDGVSVTVEPLKP